MKKYKLKKQYPITGFIEVTKQLLNDQIDSRNSSIKELKKYASDEAKEDIELHKKAIKELKAMQKEINN